MRDDTCRAAMLALLAEKPMTVRGIMAAINFGENTIRVQLMKAPFVTAGKTRENGRGVYKYGIRKTRSNDDTN